MSPVPLCVLAIVTVLIFVTKWETPAGGTKTDHIEASNDNQTRRQALGADSRQEVVWPEEREREGPQGDLKRRIMQHLGPLDVPGLDLPEPGDCAAVCEYTGTSSSGKYFPQLRKPVQCRTMMRRLAHTVHAKPIASLRAMPAELAAAYTIGGAVPVEAYPYINTAPPKIQTNVTVWDGCYAPKRRGCPVLRSDPTDVQICPPRLLKHPDYAHEGVQLQQILRKHEEQIKGGVGLVVGSRTPWIECFLLSLGARAVVTVEYGAIECKHSQIITLTPLQAAQVWGSVVLWSGGGGGGGGSDYTVLPAVLHVGPSLALVAVRLHHPLPPCANLWTNG